MDEGIDPDPSIENEQYIIPFWILRSDNVRCKDCAREAIADYINDECCVWTFILETKAKVIALFSNKDISIPSVENTPTEAADSTSDRAIAQLREI
jgi:hypothetical protein